MSKSSPGRMLLGDGSCGHKSEPLLDGPGCGSNGLETVTGPSRNKEHEQRVVPGCARCRYALARAGASNVVHCCCCGALIEGVALSLSVPAAGEQKGRR